jgi:hypothetical protein
MAPFIYRTGPATSNEKYPHHQSKAKTTMIFPFQNDGLISIVLAHCFLFVLVFLFVFIKWIEAEPVFLRF